MLLSDLLGTPVQSEGVDLGRVIDVRFVLAGQIDGSLARPELVGLIVGRHRGPVFLGYERRSTDRPALINRFFAWRQRESFLADWGDVSDVSGDLVVLAPGFQRWSTLL
jgi:hypothetical protein